MIESRRGSTGHQANPWFAIQAGEQPDEKSGEVWFGALAWSGSWRITVEQDQLDAVRVTGGFNPFDFGYELQPGQNAGDAGVLWRVQRAWAWRGFAAVASLRDCAHPSASGRRGRECRSQTAAGDLQLVGGDGIQS